MESDCPVSAQCGGCAFRTVDYAEELRFKRQRIDDAFQRIGHLDLQVEGVLARPIPCAIAIKPSTRCSRKTADR